MKLLVLLVSLWIVVCGASARSEPYLSLKASGIDTCDVVLNPADAALLSAVLTLSFSVDVNPSVADLRVLAPGWELVGTVVQDGLLSLVLMTEQPSGFSGPLVSWTVGTGCQQKSVSLHEWCLTDGAGNEWLGSGPGIPWPPPDQSVTLGCRLEFRTVPFQAEAGRPLRPAPEVELVIPDASGYTGTVLLRVGISSTSTAAWWGTTFASPEDGVATFPAFHIDQPGTYVLEAAAGVYSGYSEPFDVTSPPPFTMSDLVRAAQVVSGLAEATPDDLYRLNTHWTMTAIQCLDIFDVISIARRMVGVETTP